MRRIKLLFVALAILLFEQSSASSCDITMSTTVEEGILGQSSEFNWLGILRVRLDDGDKWQEAVSGVVLIKTRFALANADDVVRIPPRIFGSDSQVMFIAARDQPLYVAPISYVTHPEYDHSTFNSIAIIKLNINNVEEFPLTPICFSAASVDSSRYLYLVGYTDENQIWEKSIYKIQYLEQKVCNQFYDNAGLSDKNSIPTSYLCGYAPYTSTHCLWDNSMVLVSNTTGWYNMVGFSVQGPGCAAPARFINISFYRSWINSFTNSDDENYEPSGDRRTDDIEFVPVHELFIANGTRRQVISDISVHGHSFLKYPFAVDKLNHFVVEPTEDDEHTIAIYPFDEQQEQFVKACRSRRVLMYREYFEVVASKGVFGDTTYKLSMYDLRHMVCICVKLNVVCSNRSKAILSFKEEINFLEDLSNTGETPEDIFKFYPITERTATPTTKRSLEHFFRPAVIKDETRRGTVANYDLYIRFQFTVRAILKFTMFAAPPRPPPRPPSGRRAAKISTTASRRKYYWGLDEPDKMMKEPEAVVVAEHEVVQETVSGARRSEVAPVLAVLGCSLFLFLLLNLTMAKIIK